MEDIPDSLTVNWDHMGIHYVPVGTWTMEKEGSKRVEIKGVDDKDRLLLFLPLQCLAIIYTAQGKTRKCLYPSPFIFWPTPECT